MDYTKQHPHVCSLAVPDCNRFHKVSFAKITASSIPFGVLRNVTEETMEYRTVNLEANSETVSQFLSQSWNFLWKTQFGDTSVEWKFYSFPRDEILGLHLGLGGGLWNAYAQIESRQSSSTGDTTGLYYGIAFYDGIPIFASFGCSKLGLGPHVKARVHLDPKFPEKS